MPQWLSNHSTINRAWLKAGEEPALPDLLADPILQLLLLSDGISLRDVDHAVALAQRALRSRLCRCAA